MEASLSDQVREILDEEPTRELAYERIRELLSQYPPPANGSVERGEWVDAICVAAKGLSLPKP